MDAHRPIRMAACLGNPGAGADGTPHNAGFLWLDRHLARAGSRSCMSFSKKLEADVGTDPAGLVLVRPLTHMNLSGKSVAGAIRQRSFGADRLLVVHDEIDLPLGAARLKFGGGTAGHKGVANIAETLGTRGFWRLRIGVAPETGGVDPLEEYVLRRMPPAASASAGAAVELSLDIVPLMLAGDMETAMRLLHTVRQQSAPQAACP